MVWMKLRDGVDDDSIRLIVEEDLGEFCEVLFLGG